MEGSNSLINLGDISKPADTLIKKISAAIGGIFKPYQIRRIAQAEATADKIHAISQIEISELQHRAIQRFFIEEANKQNNIESITSKALPMVDEKSEPEKIEDDWIVNFFDKCRIISDDDMQNIWSKILAGQANSPGIYSKRTIDILASMDKFDADLFTKLCGFNFKLKYLTPIVYDHENDFYNSNRINFGALSHLANIGLIQFNPLANYFWKGLDQRGYVNYFDKKMWYELPESSKNKITIGKVLFTIVGDQIASVCNPVQVDGFLNYIKEIWQGLGIKVFDEPPIQIN